MTQFCAKQAVAGISQKAGSTVYGTVEQHCIVMGPTKLTFQPAIAEELVSKLPPGKPIDLIGVGSQRDLAVAGQYAKYLKDKGFDVSMSTTGMYAPPPDYKITIGDPKAPRITVLIAPSAF